MRDAGRESVARQEAGGVRPLLLVLAASFLLSLYIALTLPLLAPDEGRNAEVAREMAVSGDYLIPHLAGMPYLDKPPAFFWAAALSIRALGHTPLAARLPAMIASLLALWLVGRAAQRAGGTRCAVAAMVLLAAAPLFAGLSAYVIFDMPLTLCVTLVWLGLAHELESGASARRRLVMFAAIALGILIKGPIMLAWAVGGSLGAALLLRSWVPLRWLAWLPGWMVALGIPAIWFAMATARFPEYPHYALVEESFERMASGSFHRDQPWWFVPVVLVGGALPWSLVTPWSAARLRHAEPGVRTAAKVGLGFVLFAAVFFSLSHSKLVTYLLPAFPPLAWAAAAMWNDRTSARFRRLALAAAVVTTLILVALGSVFTLDASDSPSGAALARAIAGGGDGAVQYEHCYSPGADFLLGRTSTLISAEGRETTSNYLIRYRTTLQARGLWKALERPRTGDRAPVLVRFENSKEAPPSGATEFHHDRVFVAYRFNRPAPGTPTPTR